MKYGNKLKVREIPLIVFLIVLVVFFLVACGNTPKKTDIQPAPPTRTVSSPTAGSQKSAQASSTASANGSGTGQATPTPNGVRILPDGSGAHLGGDLGGFAGQFGQPSLQDGSYVWSDGPYSVTTGTRSPVTDVWVYGNFPDPMTQQRVCEGFFPSNAVYERVAGNTYYYTSDSGAFWLQVVAALGCEVKLGG